MVILIVVCLCGWYTIVLGICRLHLSITSHTRDQWQVPRRSAGQWRVAQLK